MADVPTDGRENLEAHGHDGAGPLDPRGMPISAGMQQAGLPSMHHAPGWPPMQNGAAPMPGHWGPPAGYPVATYHIPDQQRYGYPPPHPSSGAQPLPVPTGSPGYDPTADSHVDDAESPDGNGSGSGKGGSGSGRLLKQTRRAEQNRQAQRAFRQRKEMYIGELEKRSAELENLQAAWAQQEGRRAEMEERARALAERALALDARERSMPLHISHMALTAPIPDDLDGMRAEIESLRAQVNQRDESSRSLRIALEEVSSENKMLRQQLRDSGISID